MFLYSNHISEFSPALITLWLMSLPYLVAGYKVESVPIHDNRSCSNPLIDKDIIDDKTYQEAVWPLFLETEICIATMDPLEAMKNEMPHPCANKVAISIVFVDLQAINIDEHLISLKITYKEQWRDPRIILPRVMNPGCNLSTSQLRRKLYLEPIDFYRERLWTPDFYILGMLQSRTMALGKSFEALILYENFVVQNIATLNIDLMCPMNFNDYPFDTQICNLTLESYGIFYDRVAITWLKKKVKLLPGFSLEGYDVSVEPQLPGAVEYFDWIYPQLGVTLIIRRLRIKFILLIFVPTILHFLIAWLAIFLPKEVAQGRCIINCSTTLSLVSMLSVYTRNSPHGGFVKSLDIWSYFSVLFQFLCLLDAMLDTRLMYAASNMKRNPVEAGRASVWALITDKSNWLGKEIQLVKTLDEGSTFNDTVKDIRRMTIRNKSMSDAAGDKKAGSVSNAEELGKAEEAMGDHERRVMRAVMPAPYRLRPGYHRFLRLLIFYQEWSQYIIILWYVAFVLAFCYFYVPPLVPKK